MKTRGGQAFGRLAGVGVYPIRNAELVFRLFQGFAGFSLIVGIRIG